MTPAPRRQLAPLRWALVLLSLAGPGCERDEGMWRDQFVFIADDGAVIPIGILRWASGHAEAKGWLGEDGAWRSTFFHRFPISRPAGPDVDRALEHLSGSRGTPARVSLTRRDRGLELTLRAPSEVFVLAASDLADLGRSVDPEGASVYRAGRARWTGRGRTRLGWLVVEETPADAPRRPFVEFGDFVFLVVADRERGVIAAKRSIGLSGFDHAFTGGAGRARSTERVEVSRGDAGLELALPDLDLRAPLSIRDRQVTYGVAPDGSSIAYETLLVGGEFAGVAFTIRPAREGSAR